MSNAARIRIAGLVTALFIGVLTAAGVAVRADHRPQASTAPMATSARGEPSAASASPAPSTAFDEFDDD
jgi:hypothetical protein